MTDLGRQDHWEKVYIEKGEDRVSWFQASPALSLELIRRLDPGRDARIIDIGGGASRLVDALIDDGYHALTVLDLSATALSIAKARLAGKAALVTWIVADVTQWQPSEAYDLWHDRAAFHFLTDAADRSAYVERLVKGVRPGGHAIISTFAVDGPERCSGLPIVRYDAASLAATLGKSFALVESRRQEHQTPMGTAQRFQFSVFQRV